MHARTCADATCSAARAFHECITLVGLSMATDDTGALTTLVVAIMRCIFRPGIRY